MFVRQRGDLKNYFLTNVVIRKKYWVVLKNNTSYFESLICLDSLTNNPKKKHSKQKGDFQITLQPLKYVW